MGKQIGWYFPPECNPSDRYVDEFADSKFGIDRWVSFAREIIQNSLDVFDEEIVPHRPVLVKMEYQFFSINEIPGGDELYECMYKAHEGAVANKSNKQTIDKYFRGLKLLKGGKICCFKVSDFRTIGVTEGRDNHWGALVFDEGRSMKNRPGSAGSHGVGKKAPFIISQVNTVFYSTLNKNGANLFQGKTSLINWNDDDGITRNGKGWFGIVDESVEDRREKVVPIEQESFNEINPFFIRKDELGTDVIIVGVLLDDPELIKSKIINSVLENFFVAIYNEKLELDILGEKITKDNLDEYVEKYYISKKKNLTSVEGMENAVFGNLLNYYYAFRNGEVIEIDVVDNGKRYGKCFIYFSLDNDKNKKYYCIFRNHGMKIREINLSSA